MLLLEFVLLFVVLPLAVRFSPWPVPPIPLLWLATLYCYLALRRDATFDRAKLWNFTGATSSLPSILITFALLGTIITLLVRWRSPELLFSFVRVRPGLWALVMILYPILSVYPQSLVYRAFLMQRYAPLLRLGGIGAESQTWLLILLSAAAFALMHLIFRNPIAPAMTFVGGILFAWRYQQTGSLAISSFEHALYGCLLFTVGLGQYFYHGRMRLN